MGNDLESKCDELYSQWGDLPGVRPKEYSIWYGGSKEGSSYRVIVNKDKKKRKESWADLLINYFKFPEISLSKENKFKTKVWNNLFCSGFKVIDEEKNRRITAYTPWYSFLFRPFLGGDLIRVKLEENYYSSEQLSKPYYSEQSNESVV